MMKTLKGWLGAGTALVMLSACLTSCESDESKEDEIRHNEVLIVDNINTATTWVASEVYIIDGAVDVNANLTIEPGTTIKFKAGARLSFGYSGSTTVTANGTAGKRIVFTAYSASPAPGSWDGVFFYSNVLQNSSLTHCDFLYAGYSDEAAVNIGCKLAFNHNTVKFAKKIGVNLSPWGAFVSMEGNTVESCGTHAICLYPQALHTLGANNAMSSGNGYGIYVEGDDVGVNDGSSLVWKKQPVPFIFNGTTTVETSLTIEPGAILSFNAGGRIDFGYSANTTLTAVGTATNPIIFTSSSVSPAAGAWRGLFIYQHTSPRSTLDYCTFEYAGYDEDACVYIREVEGITVKNSVFRNSAGYGIFLDYASLSAGSTGNVFLNCAMGDIGASHD